MGKVPWPGLVEAALDACGPVGVAAVITLVGVGVGGDSAVVWSVLVLPRAEEMGCV